MSLKKFSLFTIFILAVLICKAQFYFDFEESRSFYKKAALLRSAGYKKETIVVKQMKNKLLEDSFRIIVMHYNISGNPVSTSVGSKWNPVSFTDTIEYTASGKQTIISYPDKKTSTSLSGNDSPGSISEGARLDTIQDGDLRYDYDSVNKVRKVFYKRNGRKEALARLVFYDDQGRIKKIDHAPESEKVLYNEYVYKKNKLKIYTVSSYDRLCNERMLFNDAGQVIKREVDFRRLGRWITNTYYFTYTADHLLQTEKKVSDGKVYTEVIHYYEN